MQINYIIRLIIVFLLYVPSMSFAGTEAMQGWYYYDDPTLVVESIDSLVVSSTLIPAIPFFIIPIV